MPNGNTIEYPQDAQNRRVAKKVNGQIVEKYLWQDLITLLAVYDGNDNLVWRFEYAGQRMPVAMTEGNGQKYYLHYDQVGSLRAVSDTNGNVVKEIAYDTYGNILSDSNPTFKVPFGFAGGLYDPDTKLTHFGYREYDAYTGKWTAKDPIGFAGGDSNLYGYVLGDPVNLVDPEGRNWILAAITIGSVTYYIWEWYDNLCEADQQRKRDEDKCDKIKSLVEKAKCYDKARDDRVKSWDENSRNIGKNLQENISGIGVKY